MPKAPLNPMTQLNQYELKKLSLREFVTLMNTHDEYYGGPDTIPMSEDARNWPRAVKNGYDAMIWLDHCDNQWTRTTEVMNG